MVFRIECRNRQTGDTVKVEDRAEQNPTGKDDLAL
jgi:hypothetical protein